MGAQAQAKVSPDGTVQIDPEDQTGPGWREDHLPPAQQAAHLPKAELREEDMTLEPEVFVYLPPGGPQGGDYRLTVQPGMEVTTPMGASVIIVPEITIAFPLATKRFTTPTIVSREVANLPCFLAQGKTPAEAAVAAHDAAERDIRKIKFKILTSLAGRSGRIKRLSEIQAQHSPEAKVSGIVAALRAQGTQESEIERILRAGMAQAAEPPDATPHVEKQGGAEVVVMAGMKVTPPKHVPAPPMR